ncbi:MAG: hypothetical protein ACI3VD_04805 [Candidatus Limivicinus sp.]
MMKEGTKNTLKFLFAMLILVFVVDIVVAEDPAERKAYLMVLLLILGLVSVFLLLRKFYTVRINQQRDREISKYKQPQSMQQNGPVVITGQDTHRRMEQLDSFLENGIIDKKEYAVLKKRYQSHE